MHAKHKQTPAIALILAGMAVLCAVIGIFLCRPNTQEKPGSREVYPPLGRDERLDDLRVNWPRRPGERVFEFSGPFPEMPAKMLVYRIQPPPEITEDYIREFAERHFQVLHDGAFARRPPFLVLRSEEYVLHFVEPTGFFDLLKYERAREKLSEVREDYPSDSECKRIAEEYLEERGLLSEDAYQSGIADNISAIGAITVSFSRRTGAYKTWGPGSEILVEVGVDGEIVGVSKRWCTYKPYKMAPIRTPEEAFAQLKQGKAWIRAPEGIVRIYAIEMHYFTPPQGGYVQPVYNFWFEGGGSGVVPAVRKKYLKSEEQMRREAEQAQAERRRRRRADSEYKP